MIDNRIDIPKNLYLKWVSDSIGWGVFTSAPIKSGEVVEICYCLLDNMTTAHHLNYFFRVDLVSNDVYHVLGYGAIYNHSDTPNMDWGIIDKEKRIIGFRSIRDIEPDEELRHNYGENYWKYFNKKPLI